MVKYKLSVVLPTFNIQKYIKQTLDSVLNQTYENLELIIIDDCSTDTTVSIIKSYMETDKRIKLFALEDNIGPGAARNMGITKTTGEYLTFMDHDDWQDLNRYEMMINQMLNDKTQMCFSYARAYSENTQKYKDFRWPKFSSGLLNANKNKKKIMKTFFPPWCKIYKTDFVHDNKLSFAEEGVIFDDVIFHVFLLFLLDKASIYSQVSYTHRLFKDSISYKYLNNTNFMVNEYLATLSQALKHPLAQKVGKQNLVKYYLPLIDANINKTEISKQKIFKNQLTDILKKNKVRRPLASYLANILSLRFYSDANIKKLGIPFILELVRYKNGEKKVKTLKIFTIPVIEISKIKMSLLYDNKNNQKNIKTKSTTVNFKFFPQNSNI